MSRVRATSLSLILTAMMLIGSAVAPIAQAQSTEAPDSVLFGVGYEWSNYDNDINALTGISLENILVDVMKAADDSGIELVLAEVTSGSSSVIIDQYDGDNTTWYDANLDESLELTKVHTDVFVRHGVLVDTAVITSWADLSMESDASWDVIYSIDSQQLFTLDAEYIEYIDADGLLHGMDLQLSMNSQQTLEIDFMGEISGNDETLPFNVQLDAMVNYAINDLNSEVRLAWASPIHNYVSSDYEEVSWECENDANQGGFLQFDEERVSVYDECDTFTGDYNTSSHYSLALSGIPAEDIGLEVDELDVSIADQFDSTGHFDEDEIELGGYIEFGDFLQEVTIDEAGTEVLAVEMLGAPFSITMPSVVAMSAEKAVMGDGTSPTMWDAIAEEVQDLVGGVEGDDGDGGDGEDDTYTCDNGEEIPRHWVNDGFEDCDDGSDEGVEEEGQGEDDDTYTCDNGEEIPRAYVNNGYEDCEDGSDENVDDGEGGDDDREDGDCYDEEGYMVPCEDDEGPELSERLEAIINAFSESTIESTMEAFGENLEDRLGNYEEDLAYVNADARMLWSEELGKCVGFQILVEDEDGEWYTLVGPESDALPAAPISTSIEYIIGGSSAKDEIVQMGSQDSLDDLVDESGHDVTDVDDAIRGDTPADNNTNTENNTNTDTNNVEDNSDEKDDANESVDDAEKLASEGGFVPFVSPLATIGIIALAGFAITRKRDKPFA
ncbi:low-density lipoprotein receptor class A repeat-containing protein [Deltaproteobacteria bacterium]|nr:low-density lipoprotein receptor class A repeat-containing protein [Deltaproteobacteria bacterium]